VIRIKVVQTPTLSDIDGINLDAFQLGGQYELGNTLAALFLAEGWGEPVTPDDTVEVNPVRQFGSDTPPPNLVREFFPPYYDAPTALAADRRRLARRGRTRRR
jgi:hypothetical protein